MLINNEPSVGCVSENMNCGNLEYCITTVNYWDYYNNNQTARIIEFSSISFPLIIEGIISPLIFILSFISVVFVCTRAFSNYWMSLSILGYVCLSLFMLIFVICGICFFSLSLDPFDSYELAGDCFNYEVNNSIEYADIKSVVYFELFVFMCLFTGTFISIFICIIVFLFYIRD